MEKIGGKWEDHAALFVEYRGNSCWNTFISVMSSLPDQWNEPEAGVEAIFGVAG
jgi:hypothetical protein